MDQKTTEEELFNKALSIAIRKKKIRYINDADPALSGIEEGHYHLLSPKGKFLTRIPLDQLNRPLKNKKAIKAKDCLMTSGVLLITPVILISLPTPDPAGNPLPLFFSGNAMRIWEESKNNWKLDDPQKLKMLQQTRPDFCRRHGAGFDAGVFNLDCYQRIEKLDQTFDRYIIWKCLYTPDYSNQLKLGKYSCTNDSIVLSKEESGKWKRFYGDHKPSRYEKLSSELSASLKGLMFLLVLPMWAISGIFLIASFFLIENDLVKKWLWALIIVIPLVIILL